MKRIDTSGLSCPEPVIMTKKAVKGLDGGIEVVVDNDAAVRDVGLLRCREGSGCGTENRKGNDRLSKERAKRLFRKKSFRSRTGGGISMWFS